jgi:cation transport ATPase
MSNVLPHNPEFRRTFKQGFSAAHLLIDPLLIGLALASIFYTEHNDPSVLRRTIFYAAQAGFFFFTVLWGAYQASQSLMREFSAGTWDTQRMSALSPWQMVWGKLFGATFHVWYDSACLLLLLLLLSSL